MLVGDGPGALDRFINGRNKEDVVARIGIQLALQQTGRKRGRFGFRLLQTGDALAFHDFELLLWQKGFAQNLAKDFEHSGHDAVPGLNGEAQRTDASASTTPAAAAAAAPSTPAE